MSALSTKHKLAPIFHFKYKNHATKILSVYNKGDSKIVTQN